MLNGRHPSGVLEFNGEEFERLLNAKKINLDIQRQQKRDGRMSEEMNATLIATVIADKINSINADGVGIKE
jgi:hypothetical protein